jgi:hypothetical protein
MQTNASFVRISLVAIAGVLAVACAGPSSGPTQQPQQPGSSGGTGGTGGGGSGGTTGTGGNGGTTGTGGGDNTPDGGTTTPAPDGGVTAATLGCAGYVACLSAAMSDADAMKCDSEAKASATSLLNAVDTCIGSYCLGMSGAAARCKQATDGSMQNLDGTAAFDMNGAPTGDCGACLLNGDAGLWGEACMPTTDAACNTSACAQQTSACQADK